MSVNSCQLPTRLSSSANTNQVEIHEEPHQLLELSSFTPHPGDKESNLTPAMREVDSNPWSLNLSKVSVSQHKLALYTHGPECRPRNNTSSPSPLRGLLLGLIGYERHCVLETAHVTGNLPRLSGRRRAPGMLDGPYSGAAGKVYFCRSVATHGMSHKRGLSASTPSVSW